MSKRFFITVNADVAEGVAELARRWGRPPTTAAGILLAEAVDRALHPPVDEVAQLQAAVSERDRLRRHVHERASTTSSGPALRVADRGSDGRRSLVGTGGCLASTS